MKCKHNSAIRNAQRQNKIGQVDNVYCSTCQKFVSVYVKKLEEEIGE